MSVRVCVSKVRNAVLAELELYTFDFTPFTATAPPVLIWYCKAVSPDKKTALPVTEMQVKSELVLLDSARSPRLPPQPIVEPSGDDDCQTETWSLCENSLGGSGLALRSVLLYCALVVGAINGPTL